MKRKVTPLTRKRAFETIKVVARAMLDDEKVVTYSELAARLGMPNETGQGLGPILNEAAAMCQDNDLPDVSSVVVTKESLDRGRPFPSMRSFGDQGTHVSGLAVEQVLAEQDRVRTFDWRSKASLGLGRA